jgi:hypothetical protein
MNVPRFSFPMAACAGKGMGKGKYVLPFSFVVREVSRRGLIGFFGWRVIIGLSKGLSSWKRLLCDVLDPKGRREGKGQFPHIAGAAAAQFENL